MRQSNGFLSLLALLATSAACFGEEWPKWMGPNGDNISTEPIASKWPASGPQKIWEQKVGVGYSSPIALDGKVYLLYQVGAQDTLTAFDANTGNKVWSQAYECGVPADRSGPQDTNPQSGMPLVLATPTIDGDRIYTYGGGGDLVCRNLADGSEAWHINVLKELGERILQWGQASSPLVTDKVVYVSAGKGGPAAVMVDKTSGKVIWRSQAENGGYAAPILVDVGGARQLIVFGNLAVIGMNPQTGATLWSFPWTNRAQVNAATPIYHDGHLFISSDYQTGCMMLSLSAGGAAKDWQKRDIQQKFQPGVLEQGYYYVNSGGILKCMHWPDGKIVWDASGDPKLRLNEGGSIVRDGDKFITMSERGKLSLVKATPQGFAVISQVQLFDFGQVWSSPLIYHGRLYAMGKDTLVCLDIGPQAVLAPDSGSKQVARSR